LSRIKPSDLQRIFGNACLPLVVDGKNNTHEVRHSIITGDYTYIWVSAEVVLGELAPGKGKKRKQTRRRITVYDESGYRDAGSFTSILENINSSKLFNFCGQTSVISLFRGPK
jgi:hypothetical protein